MSAILYERPAQLLFMGLAPSVADSVHLTKCVTCRNKSVQLFLTRLSLILDFI